MRMLDLFEEDVVRRDLDELLTDLCEHLIAAQAKNPEFFGMVAAGVLDPSNRFIVGINFDAGNGKRVHAERAAIERYKRRFGDIPENSMIITTLSPCNQPMHERMGCSCAELLEDEGINHVYCGYKDPSQENDLSAETTNLELKTLCKAFADTFLKNDLNEVTIVPTITPKKSAHLDVLPNDGKPIPKGEEEEYLGKPVGKLQGKVVYSFSDGGTTTYTLFDPKTRTSQLGTTGSHYSNNPNSFIVKGVYSGPANTVRASSLYFFLISELGLDLVSDIKQSEGGQRVWQDLQRRHGRKLNIHAFNTKTNEPINLDTKNDSDTHVDQSTLDVATPDQRDIAKNVRLVASLKEEILAEMNRRDFLKGAAATAGLAAMGQGIGKSNPVPKQHIERAKKALAHPHAQALKTAAEANGIKGKELAQFLAQTGHESLNFTKMKEISKDYGKYDPAVNPSKAKRLGNTNPGDGERYHGRGFIQLTGRENYRRAGKALGLPLEQQPQLAERPDIAAKIAVWFWNERVRPHVNDFGDTAQVTKPINSGLRGLQDRTDQYHAFNTILNTPKKKSWFS